MELVKSNFELHLVDFDMLGPILDLNATRLGLTPTPQLYT